MHNNLQYYGLTILLSSQLSTLYSVFKLLTYNNNNNHFYFAKNKYSDKYNDLHHIKAFPNRGCLYRLNCYVYHSLLLYLMLLLCPSLFVHAAMGGPFKSLCIHMKETRLGFWITQECICK